jgi:SAM-dependent methyltransferase
VKCKKCSLVYSNPILEYGKIEKLYKKSFTTYDEHLENLKQTYGYYLQYLNKLQVTSYKLHGSKKLILLEIGCGNGFFLEEAKRQEYDVYGVEPGEKSVEKAKKNINKNITVDIFKPGQFKKKFFDVICCFQTFDHIPDPNGLLAECYKVLRKGGLVLFFNHDIGAWQNRIMGEKSPIIDIEHTYLFDKQTMRNIFEKHKFKVLDIKSAFNIHHLSYWLQLFPIPKGLKLSLIKFFDFSKLGRIRLKLNPGNLVLFAQK